MENTGNPQSQSYTSPFEVIRQVNEQEQEFWSARALAKLLGYTEFGKFKRAIVRAEKACESSAQSVEDHFSHMSDMIEVGKGARRRTKMKISNA